MDEVAPCRRVEFAELPLPISRSFHAPAWMLCPPNSAMLVRLSSSDDGKRGGARAEHRVAAAAQIKRRDKLRKGRDAGARELGCRGLVAKSEGKLEHRLIITK